MADDRGRIVWFQNHVMHVDLDHDIGRGWAIAFLKVAIEGLRGRKGTSSAREFMELMLTALVGDLKRFQFPGTVDDLEVCLIKQAEKGDIVAEQEPS